MGEKRRGTVLRPNFDIINVNKLPSFSKRSGLRKVSKDAESATWSFRGLRVVPAPSPARGLGADRADPGGAGGQDEGGRDGVARGKEKGNSETFFNPMDTRDGDQNPIDQIDPIYLKDHKRSKTFRSSKRV